MEGERHPNLSAAETIFPLAPSRLKEILSSAHLTIQRIENMERRLEERATRLRRRACNILDSHTKQSYRSSHLRCFVTHAFHTNSPSNQEEDAGLLEDMSSVVNFFTLRLEGKLLVGHLDHASAAAHDKNTGYLAPTDDLDRSKSVEKEEDPISPIKFTEFFERVDVSFQTTYRPRKNPMARPKKNSAPKKRRTAKSSSGGGGGDTDEDQVDPRTLVLSPQSQLIWTKASSPDAHAFDFQYEAPDPSDSRYQLYSVIARTNLYSNQEHSAKDPMYEISTTLANELFPKHIPCDEETVRAAAAEAAVTANSPSKKRKADEGINVPPLPPMEDEVHILDGMTMGQIVNAFFTYIHDNNLCDETDKANINCDERLMRLFELQKFPFSGLQQLLLTKNLIKPMGTTTPVKLTYIMRVETATNYIPPQDKMADDESAPTPPSQFQFDMNVTVPALFPYRIRDLLRRVKRRELEYTSARTKARHLLVSRRAKDEEQIKKLMDQVVSGHALGREYVPIFLALAKGAPPNTEARAAAHLDARLSYLLDNVQQRLEAATNAWSKVTATIETRR